MSWEAKDVRETDTGFLSKWVLIHKKELQSGPKEPAERWQPESPGLENNVYPLLKTT